VRDVIVEHGGEQIMSCTDSVEITSEMQIDVFHRHNLRIATAGSAALDTETRAERRFA